MKRYYIGNGEYWTKKDFQRNFNGSIALFEYCWKKALKCYYGDEDLRDILDYIASSTVNDEKTDFYIHG